MQKNGILVKFLDFRRLYVWEIISTTWLKVD